MRKTLLAAAAMVAVGLTTPALAKDIKPCAADMICASAPTTVAAQLMKAGYKGLVTKDAVGDPSVESTAEGYDWQIYFYDCEEHAQCAALQFYISFTADPLYTAELANRWNRSKRFGQMGITDKGVLRVTHDLSTVGGLNPTHFNDEVSWWVSIIAELDKFLDEERKAAGKPAPAPAPASKTS